jgi:hypothetical protein
MKAVAIAVLALCLATSPALADAVTDAVRAAETAHAAGDLATAEVQLQAALAAVRGLIVQKLVDHFPSAPEGWTALEVEGADPDAAVYDRAGGLVVSRDYRTPGGSTVGVAITVDSPLLGSLRMFVRNPALSSFGGGPGMKAASVCGRDAVESSDDRGLREVSVIVGARTLASVSARDGKDAADVRALVNLLDCDGIASVVE